MTTIPNKIQYPEVYASFNERKFRYAQPLKPQNQKENAEIGEKYIDRYIKVVKNHPKSFTAAGIMTLILSGTGLFMNKNAMRARLNQGLNSIKEVSKVDKLGYGIFNFNSIKDMLSAMLINNRFTGKAGKKLFEWSKVSLIGTGGTAKWGYNSWKKKIGTIVGDSGKILTTGKATKEEQKILEELQGVIKKENLGKLADDLESGFEARTKLLREVIDKKHIQPFKDKYLPKSLRWNELKRVWENLKQGTFEKELVREGWDDTLKVLEKEINKTGSGRLKLTMKKLEKVYKKMEAVKNPSKDFKKIMGQLKTKEDVSVFKNPKKLLSSKGIIDGLEEIKKFEKNNYAGREIDLAGGGGVPEFIMPVAVGVPLSYAIVKDSEPGERIDTFKKKGGVAFVGGLVAWSLISVLKGINGIKGILLGAGSGIAIDQISKVVCKVMNKNNKPQVAQKPNEQLSAKA